uniref:Gustatory receptor n=1 Tax=Anopheles funestus TaxID=62324 RepID=A0A182RD95_ANOFN
MSYDIRITKAVLVIFKWFGQLYGILPFSSKAFIFVRSRPRLWYSRAIALLLLVIYPCAYLVILKNHTFPMLAISYYLVMVQFSLNYIFVVVLYLQVLFNPSTLLHVLNELIECAQAILRYTYSSREFTVGRRLLFKMIAIDVLQAFSWYGIFIWLQRTFGMGYVFAFWLNTIAVMQIVSATNILLAVLLWGAFLYRLINERVQIIIDNLVEMVDPAQRRDSANHDRRIVFNRIYRQLNILRTHHNALTSSIQNIVQFYDVPLALAMLYQFLIIISEIQSSNIVSIFEFIMLYEYLTLIVLRVHFHVAQLIGFFPFYCTGQFEKFYVSKWHTIWSYGVAVTLMCIYPFVYFNLTSDIPYPDLSLVNYLVWLQLILYYAALTLMYMHLLPSRAVICDMLNSLAYLYRLLNGGQPWKGKRTKKNILKNTFKVILSDNILCGFFALYCGQYITRGNLRSEIYWLFNIFAIWQSAIFINLIVFMLNICAHFYDLLNHSIRQHIRSSHYFDVQQSESSTYDALEAIKQNHHSVTTIVQTGIRVVSFPMSCLLLVQFTIIISEAEKTGILLNEFMPTAPNQRVERCVKLLHQDFKINNYGMYDVDYTLMFSMIATITSYLIMLVQFQLAEI